MDVNAKIESLRLAKEITMQLCRDLSERDRQRLVEVFDERLIEMINDCDTLEEKSRHVDYTEHLNHLSLCAGYAGIDLGLSRAIRDVRTIAYVENEAFACANLVSKIEEGVLDTAPIFTDLKEFPWRRFRDVVDILSGGFPCQPFSEAGRRQSDRDPRHLFPYIVQGIIDMGRPPIVFFENVEGIIDATLFKDHSSGDIKGTPVLLHVLRQLESLGYDVTAGIFSARELGAPHQRRRVFIMGCRSDLQDTGKRLLSRQILPENDTLFPADQLSGQYEWEPPYVISGSTALENAYCEGFQGSSPTDDDQSIGVQPTRQPTRSAIRSCHDRKGKSEVDRNPDGSSDWVDYAELSTTMDSHSDELRLLGNGVIPDVAARAFRCLWEQLNTQG